MKRYKKWRNTSPHKAIETIYNGYRFRSRLEARWAIFFNELGIEWEYEPEGFQLRSGRWYLPDFRIKCYGKRGQLHDGSFYGICEDCKHRDYSAPDHSMFASWFDEFCEYANPKTDYENPPDWIKAHNNGMGDFYSCDRKEGYYPFDLYIEVKGKMTREDATKIREFSRNHPILVVGNIPNPDTYNASSEDLKSYEMMDEIGIYPWNYETIDGDYFAAYPAVKRGHFYLDGDDSNYTTMDINIIKNAFSKARQARFEHGEGGMSYGN